MFWLRYLSMRLGQAAVILLLLSLGLFLLLKLSGDPITLMLPSDATPEDIAALRRAWKLDRPLHEQYLSFLAGLSRGDFGTSLKYNAPALPIALERFPATALLGVAAMTFAVALAIPVGIFSAVKRGTGWDRLATGVLLFGQSMPVFWLGIMLMMIFAVQLRLLPPSGFGSFKHLILPAVSLGFYSSARIARLTRTSMLEVLNQQYIITARAKGVWEFLVVVKHAFRNALIPVVTMTGIQLAALLGGAVLTETVFSWPGVGRLIVQAVYNRDYPLVQAGVFIVASMFILVNLTVDILYSAIDPRIRH